MRGVIKSGSGDSAYNVRPLQKAGEPKTAIVDPVVTALQNELDTMAARLAEKEAETERLVRALSDAFKDGEAEGRKAGFNEASDQRDDLLTTLQIGIERAVEQLSNDMSSMERLAVVLAQEVLGAIMGDHRAYAEAVTQILKHKLSQLDADALLYVQVSSLDFPNETALTALAARIGAPVSNIRASDDLKSGDCKIKLRLGVLEVGIEQQWGRFRQVFAELADAGSVK